MLEIGSQFGMKKIFSCLLPNYFPVVVIEHCAPALYRTVHQTHHVWVVFVKSDVFIALSYAFLNKSNYELSVYDF